MSYQDVWIRGKLVKKGRRSCEGRFEAIRDYMQRTRKKHPFTVLDLGANAGYFSFRLAEELDAKVTMIESSPEILQYHKQNANRNVSLIHKRVDAHYLRQLAKSKHYDAVLALSVVHHFRNYPEVIDALFSLGDCLFIEPPSIDEKKHSPSASNLIVGIYQYLLPKAPYILTYTPKTGDLNDRVKVPLRPLFVFDQQKRFHAFTPVS